MSTLIIHPEDPTTDFLKKIYEDKNFTIANIHDKFALEDSLREHHRIIMLGHGNSHGLLQNSGSHCIDDVHSPLFAGKEIISIWCYANEFFEKSILKFKPKRAFYTGMFISDMLEASMLDIETTEEEIEESNYDFANIFSSLLDETNRATILAESYITKSKLRLFNGSRFYDYR